MLFNSFEFAALLAVALAAYYSSGSWIWRRNVLIVASYVFYGAWYPPYLILLFMTTAFDFQVGLWLAKWTNQALRRLVLAGSCLLGLGVLAFFKYGDFVIAQINAVLAPYGSPPLPYYSGSLILPIGLSFYIFQSLGYVIDVYRRDVEPVRSRLDHMLFVSFFPQLMAGPILRAGQFIPQLGNPPILPAARVAGVYLVVLGLFQKVVIADNIAPLVNVVYDSPAAFTSLDLWVASYGFAFQIFCDFAGYSSMAVGLAAFFGFIVPDNFRSPYLSQGFREFWTRWHITLSQWLRDYLYISLGGNRGGRLLTYRNLLITMLLGGLWHGANWTFVVWGGMHGALLIAERIFGSAGRLLPPALWDNPVARLAKIFIVFHLVCLTWVFFRASSFDNAGAILTGMLSFDGLPLSNAIAPNAVYVFAALAFLLVQWAFHIFDRSLALPKRFRPAAAGVMLAAIVILAGEQNAFIYFQF